MVEIKLRYEGSLRCSAIHGPSGATLHTDAPTDNMGKGESFSPTDLVATALGACLMTIMGIVAQRHNIDISGTTAAVQKEMAAAPTRRIARLGVVIRVPTKVAPEDQRRLEQAARACPVHASIHPDVQMPITFEWA